MRGACEAMCPDAEARERATRGDVHALERGARGAGEASKMVKRFARTVVAGTEDAARVRTLDACERTVDHLFGVLDDARRASANASASASANALASANAFCEDRLRAVRQDLAMQGLFADDPTACGRCCAILERMIVRAVTSEAGARGGRERRRFRRGGAARATARKDVWDVAERVRGVGIRRRRSR